MAASKDFRRASFDGNRVKLSGKFVGRSTYWKLYTIENTMRVVIHSVLLAQQGPHYWDTAISPTIQRNVRRYKRAYAGRPLHATPGRHDIYYVGLSDLNEIARINRHLILPVIADIDQWIARIEKVRLPRNIVAHMNWLRAVDRRRVDAVLRDMLNLSDRLSTSIVMLIP
jgi:hypothetical protein